jgi:dihydrofolate synthase/folylpolyglutamate synthase
LEYNKNKNIFKKPNILGEHQIENVSTAIAAIFKLNELGYSFSKKIINKGILKTKWPGRLEQGKFENIKVYLDGAHNIDGAKQLLKYFKNKKIKVWLIIGMLNNKNLFDFLKKIKPILKGVVAVSIPDEKNSFIPEQIIKVCDLLGLEGFSQPSINKANQFLLKKIKPKVVLITGSLYLVGKIRDKYL